MEKCYYSYKEYIVVFEKTVDTITNENRSKVFDKQFALFRANKLKLIDIYHKIDRTLRLKEFNYDDVHDYHIGETIVSPNFDLDPEHIYSSGIHYYLSEHPAFTVDINVLFSGKIYKEFSVFNELLCVWYTQDGHIEKEINYANGHRHGHYTKYYYKNSHENSYENSHEFSNLHLCERCVGKYIDGKRYGIWTTFYPDSRTKLTGKYINGLCEDKWTHYYPNGNIKWTGKFQHNLRVGFWKKYWPDGITCFCLGKFDENNLKTGTWLYFHEESSQLKFKGNYLHGKPTGNWLQIDVDSHGKPAHVSKGKYDRGLKEGPWRSWHIGGNTQSFPQEYYSGSFHLGLKTGLWIFYYTDGRISSTGKCLNGKRIGIWTYYTTISTFYTIRY